MWAERESLTGERRVTSRHTLDTHLQFHCVFNPHAEITTTTTARHETCSSSLGSGCYRSNALCQLLLRELTGQGQQ